VLTKTWYVTSFYKFIRRSDREVGAMRVDFETLLRDLGLLGLVVLATDGVNGAVAGDKDGVEAVKAFVEAAIGPTRFKDSVSDRPPFHRISVDVRDEIVAIKNDGLPLPAGDDHHLCPSDWHAMLESPEPKTVIDTRNAYETRLGAFEGAVDPGLTAFSEWGAYLDRAEIPRDQPVLIYCTGGIRCEKAILEMRNRGFERVYQLRDGILGYLQEYPEGKFHGECFVFDDRVALDASLRPTEKSGICPGCGLPDVTERRCGWCFSRYFSCDACGPEWANACSKTCRDRVRRHGARC